MTANSQVSAICEAALEWARSGCPVFPCTAEKRPYTVHGFKDATVDEATIRDWWQRWPEAMIGVPTGAASGLAVLDLDVKKGKNGLAIIADWQSLSPVIVNTRSGGRHLYFRDDGTIPNSTDRLGLGVDTRGNGGYVIVPPSAGYTFSGSQDLAALPPWPGKYRLPTRAEAEPIECQRQADLTLVAKAVAAIPNPDMGWDDWTRIGMAIFEAVGGGKQGLTLFDAWSQKSAKYDASSTSERWQGITNSPPSNIGVGTLFFEADKADPNWRVRGAKLSAGSALPTTKHGDPIPVTAWLIRNRISEVGAGLLAGPWGSYKTFMALDIAAHVITGWDWTGEPVYRRGGVLLFAAEGSGGLPLRVAAIAEHLIANDVRAAQLSELDFGRLPIEWTSSCPVLVGTGKSDPLPQMAATASAAEKRFQDEFGLPLALIVIDTLAASAGWKDENDNAEAARVLSVLRDLSRAANCAVLGIDHAGKNQDQGTRGASAKEANSDFVLSILADKKPSGEVLNTRLAFRKLRDGPQGSELPFECKLVDMGVDEKQMPITSRVINWRVSKASRPTPASASAQAFEEALTTALKSAGASMQLDGAQRYAAPREVVRRAFGNAYQSGAGLKPSASNEGFRRALRQAVDSCRAGLGTCEGQEWIWRETAL